MQKILNKRLLRDLKSNFLRYLALTLLVVMGMYVVVGVIGSAENTITGTAECRTADNCEDGQFEVFIPLDSGQEKALTDDGADIEKMFSIDIDLENGSTIRFFVNRSNINLVHLDSGRLAENIGEAVLEKRYCEENNISVGDSISLGEITLDVVGIGSTPDYDMPVKSMADASVESSVFGLAFVTDSQYENILINSAQKAENYCYAYKLNSISDDELKQKIKSLDFDYTKVTDIFFQEMIADTIGKKDDLQNGINELYDGSKKLTDGLSKLDENSVDLNKGASEIFNSYILQANNSLAVYGITDTLTADNYSEILDKYIAATQNADLISLKNTLDNLHKFVSGTAEYTDGVNKAADGSQELSDGISTLKSDTDEMLDEFFSVEIDNLTSFVKAADNPRIAGAAGDMLMNKQMGLIAGVIIMCLFTYVISVFVIHQIQTESSVIGALYALGVKKKNLILHYLTMPTIISFFGGLIGAAIGFSNVGIGVQMQDTYNYFSVPQLDTIYPTYLIIYSIIMPPVVSAIVNYLVINKKLSQTALSLIRNEQKTGTYSSINLKDKSFIRSFRIRQMLRETRTGITVIAGMLISLMIFMLGLNCYVLCSNVQKDMQSDTKYEYMYMLKYPEKLVPDGAEACYSESLSKTYLDFTLDITIMGIDGDNRYFDFDVPTGKSKLLISKSVQQKYGLSVGDKLILSDNSNEMDYAFTVEDVCDYSAGLMVFMDIDSLRELFGREDDYYNVLLSDNALSIDGGRLYSVTTMTDIDRASEVFINLMGPTYVMLISVAIVIFCAVMYLMMNVMIDRAGFGISLIKIFGFRTGEIRKLYLDGNMYVIAVGAAICIPISKKLADLLYPWLIANTACGMSLAFPWYYYVMIFAGVMAAYFVINAMLTGKLSRISPVDVLKNRE